MGEVDKALSSLSCLSYFSYNGPSKVAIDHFIYLPGKHSFIRFKRALADKAA